MSLGHHEIAEAGHRILNPFTEEKLRLLGQVAGVSAGTRVLDLACGKGEMLCRWAEWFGSGGLGVDLSPVFLGAAVARAASDIGRPRARQVEVGLKAVPAALPAEPGLLEAADGHRGVEHAE